jgi:hypothetical protein
MNDRDREELQAPSDQFREAIAREPDPPFDQEARERVGQMIGRAARQGASAFGYLTLRE